MNRATEATDRRAVGGGSQLLQTRCGRRRQEGGEVDRAEAAARAEGSGDVRVAGDVDLAAQQREVGRQQVGGRRPVGHTLRPGLEDDRRRAQDRKPVSGDDADAVDRGAARPAT
jgi:hypothetical protein